jgi:hypothetical protein
MMIFCNFDTSRGRKSKGLGWECLTPEPGKTEGQTEKQGDGTFLAVRSRRFNTPTGYALSPNHALSCLLRKLIRRCPVGWAAAPVQTHQLTGESMSIMKKSISIGFLAFACAAATAAYASDPDVVALNATFITKTNTKDQNPNLDIKIYDNKKGLLAENKDIPGQWSDNTIDSITLDLKKPFKRSDLSKVQLDIHPSGKDKWEFDYNIAITYSDNTVVWQRWNGKVLTQEKPTTSDSFSGQ